MANFFDEYPKFYETSKTGAVPRRLSFRHHLIIEQNTPMLDGKTIIEIASHDGRWAFAALKAGAKSVYGIEPRKHLVDNANATFSHYGVPASAYKFVCEDGYHEMERLERVGETFDTAMVLGFLYHTARQYEIIHRLSKLGCSAIIVDTNVLRNVTEPIVRFAMEDTAGEARLFSPGNAVDLGGTPSLVAVHYMLRAAGYQPQLITATCAIPATQCADYRGGSRFTIVGVR